MRSLIALFFAAWLPAAAAQTYPAVLLDGFEQGSEQHWRQLGDCRALLGMPRSGELALRCKPGSSVLFSNQPLSEMGVLELWVKPETDITSYRI